MIEVVQSCDLLKLMFVIIVGITSSKCGGIASLCWSLFTIGLMWESGFYLIGPVSLTMMTCINNNTRFVEGVVKPRAQTIVVICAPVIHHH